MGKIGKPAPVKLVIGFIYKEELPLKKSSDILKRYFGEVDFKSQALEFNLTSYYKEEMGQGLKRKFISFKKLILPQSLPKIKIISNKIETKFSIDKRRVINIDPGYLDLAKLILATTKDYCHRIYINNGIYAEVTLTYQGKSFRPWDWTYPDYRTQEYIGIFNNIREIYSKQIQCTPHI
ncbi:MAG: DUF4416 family protein [Candidatus Omnitrophica bacterium]|nr:DUF4416 family protein [Candidatus Omnitrophota bacterium]MBU1869299.1 DUF4416 family protein [Candidatus Omnitrophota bacterium]